MVASSVSLFNRIALHHARTHAIVTLSLPCLFFLLYRLLHFHAFRHMHWCISFRYARRTTHGHETHDFGAELEDGEWWILLEDGWMDPDVHDRRQMLAKRVSSN